MHINDMADSDGSFNLNENSSHSASTLANGSHGLWRINDTTLDGRVEPWCHDLQSSDLLYSATHHSSPLRQIVAVAFLVLLIFTVIGNAFVVLVVIIDRRLRRITSGLIVSMAVADVLVALSLELHGVIMVFDQSDAHLSSTMCELSIGMDIYFGLAELLHLVCLAVERYLAICHPFLYERCGKKFLTLIIISAWTVPIIFSFLPILTLWDQVRQEEIYHCLESLHVDRCVFFPNKVFSSILFGVMFALPTILLLFCYTKILQIALTHRRRIDTQTTLGSYNESIPEIKVIADQNDCRKGTNSKPMTEEPSVDDSLCSNTIYFDAKHSTPEQDAKSNSPSPEETPFLEKNETEKSNETTLFSPHVNDSPTDQNQISTKSSNTKMSTMCQPITQNVISKANRTKCHNICRAIFGIDDFFRASRSIVYVCITFLLTWTPYWTLILISPFIGPQNIPKPAVLAALAMFSLGTAINPFVYYFSNTEIRRGIFRVVKRLCYDYGRCSNDLDF